MTSFSDAAWQLNLKLYEATRDMPFNQELARGILPETKFKHYMIQDAHYLEGFARALALVAAKGWGTNDVVQFAEASQVAIVVERALHAEYFKVFGVSREAFLAAERSPACNHYVSFLIATAAQEPFEVGLAALLPCFWIYREVGHAVHATAHQDNPYRAWIDTYSGEAFSEAVDGVIKTIDQVAADCSPRSVTRMQHAYRCSAQLEWIFWDSAYRLETWPT